MVASLLNPLLDWFKEDKSGNRQFGSFPLRQTHVVGLLPEPFSRGSRKSKPLQEGVDSIQRNEELCFDYGEARTPRRMVGE